MAVHPLQTVGTPPENYVGLELDLFSHATHWKNYWSQFVTPHLKGNVLEVGAGNGNNTALLCRAEIDRWICAEPDAKLLKKVEEKVFSRAKDFRTVRGTIHAVSENDFDAILYLDVLEHIQEDRAELEQASAKLKPGGKLILLSPSHPFLFSEFDRTIGHFRRYNRESLRGCVPSPLKEIELKYLDSVGLFASLANRWVLKKSYPSLADIKLWDSWMVPVSLWTDRLTQFHFGKSILGIWEKN